MHNNTGRNKKYQTEVVIKMNEKVVAEAEVVIRMNAEVVAYDKSDTNRNNSIRFSANRHMTKFRRIRLFSDCQELSDIQKL